MAEKTCENSSWIHLVQFFPADLEFSWGHKQLIGTGGAISRVKIGWCCQSDAASNISRD